MCPDLLGVTVYDPAGRPENVNAPEESAVTVAVAAPVNLTVAPEPLLTVPDMEKVCTIEVKFAEVLAPFTVTALLVGV